MNDRALLRALQLASAAALSGTLLTASLPAFADGPTPPSGGDGKGISAFILGLRQSLAGGGVSAMGSAAHWMDKLEIGIGTGGDMRPGMGLVALESGTRLVPVNPAAAKHAAASDENFDGSGASPRSQHPLSLASLSEATLSSADNGWELGHAQTNFGADPETDLASGVTRGPVVGSALAEHSLSGHDVEFGLPLPYLDGVHIAAARYWWGDGVFTPAVQGTRVSMKMNLMPNVQFEGGASQDAVHGQSEFVGLRYSMALDDPKSKR
jgi:hypothetical protein